MIGAALSGFYRTAECLTALVSEGGEARGVVVDVPRFTAAEKKVVETAIRQEYDYIIVGAGAAGCVLADKLTADGKTKVLVLEAGGKTDSLVVKMPAALTRCFLNPVLDWNLYGEEESQLDSKKVYLARGRGLGGSTCTNATLYGRGTAEDYDSWGLKGWTSKDVLPWFIAAEDQSDGTLAPTVHGKGGCMKVENPRYHSPLHEAFFAAASASGIHYNPDFNDWNRPQTGFGEFQVTQDWGVRADMYSRCIKGGAYRRSNLKVISHATVLKVVTEDRQGVANAVGVEFALGPEGQFGTFTAKVKPGSGEVIMSAGAIHTPHILMLSGIGPQQELAKVGISCKVDLPAVGQHLQDHPATLVAYKLKDELKHMCWTNEIFQSDHGIKPYALLQWAVLGTGPLTTTSCDHGAYLNTRGKGQPDVQLRFAPGMALDPDALQSLRQAGELKRLKMDWPAGFTLQLLGSRPESSGRLGLRSANPFDKPVFVTGYFSDPNGADLASLRDAIKLARKLVSEAALAKVIAEEVHPGPKVESDADLDAYIKKSACSGNAVVGTCRMGVSPAEGAAVSSNDFKVFGTSGLRVIDSSLLPKLPGAQTAAPTVMIAERAAALLKGKIKGCAL